MPKGNLAGASDKIAGLCYPLLQLNCPRANLGIYRTLPHVLGMVVLPLGDEEVGGKFKYQNVFKSELVSIRRNVPLNSARSAVTLNTSILLLLIVES